VEGRKEKASDLIKKAPSFRKRPRKAGAKMKKLF
jgi:hypothetical protein